MNQDQADALTDHNIEKRKEREMSLDKTELGYTLDYFNARERSTAEVQEALEIAVKALTKILNCKQADPARYVRECDTIALDAMVNIESRVP